MTILGIPAVFVGTALLLAVIGLVCVVVARRDDRRTILVGLTILAIAFFVVPTRVHERYLFPFFALGAILAATSFRWRLAYLALALANFANLYAVLTTPFYNNPGISDWLGVGDAIRSQAGVTIAALTHLAVGLWALTELRRGAQVRLDAETEADALDDKEPIRWTIPEPAPAPRPTPGRPPVPQLPASARSASRAQARPSRAPAPGASARLVSRGQGIKPDRRSAPRRSALLHRSRPWARSTARNGADQASCGGLVGRQPRLADRSRGLWGERGGRIDKLDLLIMAVLLVGVLTLRLFRLSDPYEFHFDEVYHARTAMEFLQDWRYGMPHDIYEFTHPTWPSTPWPKGSPTSATTR